MIRKISYKTSRDMRRLKELLDAGYDVVCFITYDWCSHHNPNYQPMMVTDVCIARYIGDGRYSRYSIASRGNGYFEYWLSKFDYDYTFLEWLESNDIQFIEPTIIKEN